MKKSKYIPMLLAAVLALPLASMAAERMPPMGERGERGPGPHFLRGLDLSDSQEDKLFQLMHGQEPYLREQRRAHEKAMDALHDMRSADKFDDAAAVKLAQAAAQAQANITLARVRTHQKVLALLTPEQRKQLEERKARPHRGGAFHER
ncbi:periplasmic heavy metal sensor [Pseudoduganella sp. DS3]|uniref:Periplasmic heavy metal sensor n=1 Tax=Pseudoduganella guangdongensis TaxID=2692179 RepID=A0A6N9HK99_9BURK|nr:Spy/CpxP family protein refolding chaperone [Pseudoduganella guangdongensis]MYN03766.1 periplasmic heavy metal sensor [Pseudoduganella guangdongensis]